MASPSRRLTYDQKILLYTLLAGAPAVLVSMGFIWLGDWSAKVEWTLTLLIIGFWLGSAPVCAPGR